MQFNSDTHQSSYTHSMSSRKYLASIYRVLSLASLTFVFGCLHSFTSSGTHLSLMMLYVLILVLGGGVLFPCGDGFVRILLVLVVGLSLVRRVTSFSIGACRELLCFRYPMKSFIGEECFRISGIVDRHRIFSYFFFQHFFFVCSQLECPLFSFDVVLQTSLTYQQLLG
jgi:hypothetical protein